MIDITDNSKWLAIQYQDTNVQVLLDGFHAVLQQYLADVINEFSEKFDIRTADGVWLDYIGYKVGVFERPAVPVTQDEYFGFSGSPGTGFNQASFLAASEDTLPVDDDTFREFLLVRYQQIIATCTNDNIRDILLLIFDDALVIDNQNMTMTITITTTKGFTLVQSLLQAGVVTKPAAVKLDGQIVFDNYFGFANSGGTGFNQSPFVYNFT
jgi:hypothetical protein